MYQQYMPHIRHKIKTNVEPLRFHSMHACAFLSRHSFSLSLSLTSHAWWCDTFTFTSNPTLLSSHSLSSPSHSPHYIILATPIRLNIHLYRTNRPPIPVFSPSASHAARRRKCVWVCVCEWQFVCMQNTRNASTIHYVYKCTKCSEFDSNLNTLTPYVHCTVLYYNRSDCVCVCEQQNLVE